MRKINENDYVSYTIAGNGWSLTVSTFKRALGEWNNIPAGRGNILYGNKPNGTRAIIDSK